LDRRLGESQSPSGCGRKEKQLLLLPVILGCLSSLWIRENFLLLLGIKPQFLGHPVSSLVITTLAKLFQLHAHKRKVTNACTFSDFAEKKKLAARQRDEAWEGTLGEK
jgi:hypothetical protein